jgi:phosphatidate cytidylyltransferase
MKARIAVAAAGAPALAAILLLCPAWATALLVCAISVASARELARAAGMGGETFVIWPMLFAALTAAAAYVYGGGAVFAALLAVASAVVFARAAALYKTPHHKSAGQIFCVIFAGVVMPEMLSGITRLRMLENGSAYVLLPFVSAFITDAGAYFTGIALGRRPAFPKISPKKTVEGCVGGAVFGVGGVLLYAELAERFAGVNMPLWAALSAGALGTVMTQLGDLAFSYIKREFGVKDFGVLLPGHGGALDRFDSMVFAAPVMYAFVGALPVIGEVSQH